MEEVRSRSKSEDGDEIVEEDKRKEEVEERSKDEDGS